MEEINQEEFAPAIVVDMDEELVGLEPDDAQPKEEAE